MTRVKVCGCRSVEIALAAADAGADFIGLMFAPSSRRRIDVEDASEIVRALGTPLSEIEMRDPPAMYRAQSDDLRSWFEHGASALDRMLERKRPLTVGVFAGNEAEEINEIVNECGIDLIQLSGGEPWSACMVANRQVIKAVHVAPDDDAVGVLGRIETGSAMAVMLDKRSEAGFGGLGETLSWGVAAQVAGSMPVWLAGGLTPENVAEAVRAVRPWGVDVSSGVETEGAKDVAKIRAFIGAVRVSS
jgi:phosphoribosylanthranilate isomerase